MFVKVATVECRNGASDVDLDLVVMLCCVLVVKIMCRVVLPFC